MTLVFIAWLIGAWCALGLVMLVCAILIDAVFSALTSRRTKW